MFVSIKQVQSHYSLYSFWERLKWLKVTQFLFLFRRPNLRIKVNQVKDSKGYTGELEKLRCDNSEIVSKVNLKAAFFKEMRLRVWGYLQGEYLYLVTERGLIMKKKTYSIVRRKHIVS